MSLALSAAYQASRVLDMQDWIADRQFGKKRKQFIQRWVKVITGWNSVQSDLMPESFTATMLMGRGTNALFPGNIEPYGFLHRTTTLSSGNTLEKMYWGNRFSFITEGDSQWRKHMMQQKDDDFSLGAPGSNFDSIS